MTGGGVLEGERSREKADKQKEGRKEEERNSEATEDRKHLPLTRDYSFCRSRVQQDFTTSGISR